MTKNILIDLRKKSLSSQIGIVLESFHSKELFEEIGIDRFFYDIPSISDWANFINQD